MNIGASHGDDWGLLRKRVLGGAPPERLSLPDGTTEVGVQDILADGRFVVAFPATDSADPAIHVRTGWR